MPLRFFRPALAASLSREFRAGDVMWPPAQTHIGSNVAPRRPTC